MTENAKCAAQNFRREANGKKQTAEKKNNKTHLEVKMLVQ